VIFRYLSVHDGRVSEIAPSPSLHPVTLLLPHGGGDTLCPRYGRPRSGQAGARTLGRVSISRFQSM